MVLFIKNIFKFIVVGLLLIILPIFFIDNYYGNDHFQVKHNYFWHKASPKKINTVFFGSSRICRQLNPMIFDSLLSDYSISSFNFASPATYNPESFYLYEKFLSEIDNKKIKYAFIEFQVVTDIALKNILTERASYWMNFNNVNFATKYYLNSVEKKTSKIKNIANYYMTFLYKIFSIKKLKYINHKEDNLKFLGRHEDGFYSLEQEMLDMGGVNELTNRRNKFFADTLIHQKKIKASIDFKLKKINPVFLQKIKEIIEISRKKGIHVYFVIPPKLPNYDDLYPYKAYFPSDNFLDISSYQKYPELYLAKFTFDDGHLNEEGAVLFTNYVANEFRRKTPLNQ